jgi:proteasome lid subunit RPN8/RPN11
MEIGTMTLTLRRSQIESVLEHVSRGRPNEACGLFAGRDGVVQVVYSLTNADATPVSYLIDSHEQLESFNDAEARGLEIVGCFHSHVGSAAYPSETDVRQAFYPEWIYAIVSLRSEEPELRAFRILHGETYEVPVEVVG